MANIKSAPSQEFVSIKEIRDGVIILKDGSMRMILMASSLNFALKSADEQEATISQYQNFLNSLDFHVQFYIQSRGLNIETYLEALRKKEREQTDELLKIQTKEYIDFIRDFVASTKIVNKTFYIVIPYSSTIFEKKNNPFSAFLDKILSSGKKTPAISQNDFEKEKNQLLQRADTVTQGLARAGIRTVPLNTEELIELFYGLYNPEEEERTSIPKQEYATI
ncbi:conjugal transfer protein TraC [Patescibacteria group bacterium]|nr:conjugal transfer protein TraC [Patescibacteria group bacterium]